MMSIVIKKYCVSKLIESLNNEKKMKKKNDINTYDKMKI